MRPVGIGVRLKIADMSDGCVEVEWLSAAQRHRPVRIIAPLPIERHCPSLIPGRRPSLGEPQQWLPIATVQHEFKPLPIGDQSVRETVRLDKHAMAWPFAVKGETTALVPNLNEPTVKVQKIGCAHRLSLDQERFGQFVGRLQWALRK